MAGNFIAFEGIDGAGKFTQLAKTRFWLEKLGHNVTWSSEPNDHTSPIGKHIRAILKREQPRPTDPVEFQRMYVIDRAQDIICFIQPTIARGTMYLIERYGLSTVAYGMLSGTSPETFIRLHEAVLGSSLVWPDLTILIDISAKEAIRRLAAVRGEPQLFERTDFLARVRKHYLALADHPYFRHRVAVVNGERNEDEVFAAIQKLIEPRLPRRS